MVGIRKLRSWTTSTKRLALLTVLTMVAAQVGQSPVYAESRPPTKPPKPDPGPVVRGVHPLASHFAPPVESSRPYQPMATAWPAPATTSLQVPQPTAGARLGAVSRSQAAPVQIQAVAGKDGI